MYSDDDKLLHPAYLMNNNSDLSGPDFIEIGQLLEIHKQVESGKREYDPFVIWSEDQKKARLP